MKNAERGTRNAEQSQRRPLRGFDPDVERVADSPHSKNSPAIVINSDDPLHERACLRCACTNDNACNIGHDIPGFPVIACAWACESIDLCTHCVRPDEVALLDDLNRLEHAAAHVNQLVGEWTVMFHQRLAAEAREKVSAVESSTLNVERSPGGPR